MQRFKQAQSRSSPSLPTGGPLELKPPADPPPRNAGQPLSRKTVKSLTFVLGLATLLATVIGVFVFLPDYAAKSEGRRSEAKALGPAGVVSQRPLAWPGGGESETSEEPSQDRLSNASATPSARERGRAEQALGDWLRAHARLEAKQVSEWGGVGYAEARATSAAADKALQQAKYAAASAGYGQAVATLEHLEDSIPEVLERTLNAGAKAIESGDANAALQAYTLALALAPAHAGAEQGLARAKKLEQVLTLMATGEAHERDGRLALAYADFQTAAQLDSARPQVQAALARVREHIANEQFQAAMSEGFSALQRGRFQDALSAFQKATAFRPEALEVKDGIAQATQGLRAARIEDLGQRALDQEAAERWGEALAAYEAALAIDSTLAFAQQGRTRTQQLGQVAAKLSYYLDNPELLTSDRVYQRALAFLDEASAITPQRPKLKAQLRRFKAQLVLAGTPLTVELRSDAATGIMIYKVGKLGRFTAQTVELRPGTYTLLGVRPGYRDVRRTLTLTPGEPTAPVYIACQERV